MGMGWGEGCPAKSESFLKKVEQGSCWSKEGDGSETEGVSCLIH